MTKNGLIAIQCNDFLDSYLKCVKEPDRKCEECYRLYNIHELCKTMLGSKWIRERQGQIMKEPKKMN